VKNEKLQYYALIAEIAGGIAVIVTLVVLIFEIRGNTQAVRTATYDALAADIANWRSNFVTDNELAEIDFIVFTEGRDSLTPRQARRDSSHTLILFQHVERVFLQWEAGNLDDSDWERFRRVLCNPAGSPRFEEYVGQRLDLVTTDRFTDYRNNQCPE